MLCYYLKKYSEMAHPLLYISTKQKTKLKNHMTKGARQMAEKIKKDQRSRLGYGSSYRKGEKADLGKKGEIDAVFGWPGVDG
jgi:hypothetical protein